MDQQERIQAASRFLLQSPPGEINDVLNDVRDIIADDEALQAGILPSLEEYNLEQFITADVPGCEHQVIVSEAGRIKDVPEGESRFLDPRSKTTFIFDHLRLEASDPQPFAADESSEEFRSALETATTTYLANHFVDGVTTVFSTPESSGNFIIQVVANKYNPSNFWSGRWRSEYKIDLNSKKVEGKILVNVHYYEQGNVQLSTSHSLSFALPPTISANSPPVQASDKIIALIEHEEGKYQASLNDAYQGMSEKTFKGLRRALPLTRQKLDWDKVLGYKLGAELTSSRNVLGGS
ncbi:F-actin capping protein, alpha subunit [Fomitiporia mediterranea MF3/22]|uniref:F-actin capping protein, alpha subunit n=1 Tax=Fomitiporia mediterranea (strain MF3/22) TaxID=694068 RepID=UPI00044086A5|nr:F-actin capping protein, alpha subunit [Fomitiporia mediterranea MF3/22]EJC97914.1 F-actin capping protein, alpha subunit [Fomitiporia mediterranea MF3/22]